MPLVAQDLVVQYDHDHLDAHAFRGLELRPHVREAAISSEAEHVAAGRGEFRTQRRGKSPAQAREPTARQEAHAGAACGEEVGRPDRGVARVAHHDRFGREHPVEFLHQAFGADRRGGRRQVRGGLRAVGGMPAGDRLRHAGGCLPARRKVLRCDGLAELLQRQSCIAHQAQRLVVATHLEAVDIDMDEACRLREQRPRVGAVLVGTGTDQQDDVGLVDQRPQMPRTAARAHEVADNAHRQRMRLVDAALAHHRGRHRDAGRLLERCQRRLRARQMHAAASDDQRRPGRSQQPRGLLDQCRVRAATVERIRAQ